MPPREALQRLPSRRRDRHDALQDLPALRHDDATQASLLAGWKALCDRDEQAWLAAGYTPETLDRLDEEWCRAMEEDDDWPEDPLCPPPRNAVA